MILLRHKASSKHRKSKIFNMFLTDRTCILTGMLSSVSDLDLMSTIYQLCLDILCWLISLSMGQKMLYSISNHISQVHSLLPNLKRHHTRRDWLKTQTFGVCIKVDMKSKVKQSKILN